jgi:hypothetical protein
MGSVLAAAGFYKKSICGTRRPVKPSTSTLKDTGRLVNEVKLTARCSSITERRSHRAEKIRPLKFGIGRDQAVSVASSKVTMIGFKVSASARRVTLRF